MLRDQIVHSLGAKLSRNSYSILLEFDLFQDILSLHVENEVLFMRFS